MQKKTLIDILEKGKKILTLLAHPKIKFRDYYVPFKILIHIMLLVIIKTYSSFLKYVFDEE